MPTCTGPPAQTWQPPYSVALLSYVKPQVEKATDIEKRQLSWQRGKRIATKAFHITE
jgi:hypothetical protein